MKGRHFRGRVLKGSGAEREWFQGSCVEVKWFSLPALLPVGPVWVTGGVVSEG